MPDHYFWKYSEVDGIQIYIFGLFTETTPLKKSMIAYFSKTFHLERQLV
jgi:hypothetical protein